MSLTLVVLAAGMGSRYGGLKQIDPVGPGGETVLDYAVFDAIRAGFDRVVFVIRPDFAEVFRDSIGRRYVGRIEVGYAFQTVETLPPGLAPSGGREKPWGTGHAVWCAANAVPGNFAVINADDFYGADSFRRLAEFLRAEPPGATGPAPFALVGFRLANTLSAHGTVSRGVCDLGSDGRLRQITEQTSIAAADVGAGRRFSGREVVSMNCWGFTRALFPALDGQLRGFLEAAALAKTTRTGGDPLETEFYLPNVISTMISRDEAEVKVVPTDGTWFGITYRDDRPGVAAALAELVGRGEYPAKLF